MKIKLLVGLLSFALCSCTDINQNNKIEMGELDYNVCKATVTNLISKSTSFDGKEDIEYFTFTYLDDLKIAIIKSDGISEEQHDNLGVDVYKKSFPKINELIDKFILKNDPSGIVSSISYSNNDCALQMNLVFDTKDSTLFENIINNIKDDARFTLDSKDPSGLAYRYIIVGTNEFIEVNAKEENKINIGYAASYFNEE